MLQQCGAFDCRRRALASPSRPREVVRGRRVGRMRERAQEWAAMARSSALKDPTVAAVPLYFATMAAENAALKRRLARRGPSAGDYERRDTIASLSMGVISLVAPLIAPKVLGPFTPGRGRFGRQVVKA